MATNEEPKTEPSQRKIWYENKLYVILWLIFFFPVGIYGVWKTSGWSKRTKWILTAVPFVLYFWMMISASMAPPTLTLNGAIKTEAQGQKYRIAGQVNPSVSKVKVNDVEVKVESDGQFSYILQLKDGQNEIIISATNGGKTVEAKRTVNKLSAEEIAKRKADAEAKAKAEADKKVQEEAQKAEVTKELDAEVRFSTTAFMIKNKESKDWANCQFVLNGKLLGSDFTYKSSEGIKANDSIIILMSDFTKSDGTMFNVYTTKPKNLFISCDVGSNHRTGYYAISE